jgi:Fe-S cluster assembly iron-binding protein IscA
MLGTFRSILRHTLSLTTSLTRQVGIRVDVKKRGCSGNAFHLEYATDIKPMEEIIATDGKAAR